MPVFDIQCSQVEEVVEIHFGGDPEPRGNPEYRGFSCQTEAECRKAGIPCELFTIAGFRPFDVAAAFEHFNS
ncbi:MAG: hypothetical protein H6839_11575 [Planctomycetes bacterium]|nr:hypothetical protein [Planctomycetota bacterium]